MRCREAYSNPQPGAMMTAGSSVSSRAMPVRRFACGQYERLLFENRSLSADVSPGRHGFGMRIFEGRVVCSSPPFRMRIPTPAQMPVHAHAPSKIEMKIKKMTSPSGCGLYSCAAVAAAVVAVLDMRDNRGICLINFVVHRTFPSPFRPAPPHSPLRCLLSPSHLCFPKMRADGEGGRAAPGRPAAPLHSIATAWLSVGRLW